MPEMILGGCNSTYGSCYLKYPFLYYASGPNILIHNLSTHITENSLQGHKSKVNCINFIKEKIVSGSTDKKLIVWENFRVFQELELTSAIISITTNTKYIISITNDGILSIFSENLEKLQIFNFSKNLQETCAIETLENSDFLATGGADARIHVYISKNNEFVYAVSLEGHVRNIRSLSFRSNNGELWLASAGQDSFVRIWKFFKNFDENDENRISNQGIYTIGTIKCKLDAVLSGHSNLVSSVVWINNTILTASHDFSVILWSEDANSLTWIPKSTFGQLGGNKNIFIGALGDENQIIAYSYSGGFYHWIKDNEKWKASIAPTGHCGMITDIIIHNDFVLTSSLDSTCRLWTFFNGYWAESSRPMVHGYEINSIAFSSLQLVSGGDEKILRLFDPSVSTSEILNKQNITFSAFSRGSSQVLGLTTKTTLTSEIDLNTVAVTEDILNSYTLWPESNKLYGHGYEISVTTTNHSGTILASACKSQTKDHAKVFLWDLSSKQKIDELEFHSLSVTDMSFSNNDSFLLTVSRDRSWCLYEYCEGYKIKLFNQVHSRVIYTCCWSPDDSKFATGSRDKKLRVWTLKGENLSTFNFLYPVTASCFVSDNIIAAGLESGEVKIMNIDKKTEEKNYFHGDSVTKIKYSKGKLYSISSDHTLRIYKIELA